MKTFFLLIHLLTTVGLIAAILLQAKGVGVSAVFGGESSFYRSRRGVEKLLIYATIFLAAVFVATSIIGLLL